jgi:hypothetical protein
MQLGCSNLLNCLVTNGLTVLFTLADKLDVPFDGDHVNIVVEKSTKAFKATDELWLVVQCSPRPSETTLPVNGVEDFNAVPGLAVRLRASPFAKVYVLTALGLFHWDRSNGWGDASPRRSSVHQQPLSVQDLTNVLTDPEWLADPDAKALEEAARVLRGLRDWAKRSST